MPCKTERVNKASNEVVFTLDFCIFQLHFTAPEPQHLRITECNCHNASWIFFFFFFFPKTLDLVLLKVMAHHNCSSWSLTCPPDSSPNSGYSQQYFIHCLHFFHSVITHPMLLSYWVSPTLVIRNEPSHMGPWRPRFRVSHRSVFVIGHWRESGSPSLSADHVGNNAQLSAPRKEKKKTKQAPTLSGSSLTRPRTLHAILVSWLQSGMRDVCVQPHFRNTSQWTLDLCPCSLSWLETEFGKMFHCGA